MHNNNFYFNAVNALRDGLVITEKKDGKHLIAFANQAFEKLSGYREAEIIGKDCTFLQGQDNSQPEIAQINSALNNGESALVTIRNYRKDGSLFWNELSISPIRNEQGNITHFIGIQKDVSERVALENQLKAVNATLYDLNEKLKKESRIDELTGFFNRKALREEVSILWNSAIRARASIAIFFIDIDHFKRINDNYGHRVGDICLKSVAVELEDNFSRGSDIKIRYGGEEFLVISFGNDSTTATELANKFLHAVASKKIIVKKPDIYISLTVSIGVVSLIPYANANLDAMIDTSDKAMYEAKIRGRNQAVTTEI